jgi:hypothetical protein
VAFPADLFAEAFFERPDCGRDVTPTRIGNSCAG